MEAQNDKIIYESLNYLTFFFFKKNFEGLSRKIWGGGGQGPPRSSRGSATVSMYVVFNNQWTLEF